MAVRVLVLNSGSSSLKASIVHSGVEQTLAEWTSRWDAGPSTSAIETAVREAIDSLTEAGHELAVDAVGHRVVHGGAEFTSAVVVDDEVLSRLGGLVDLAPLHNLTAVETIRSARRILPQFPHIAAFDTAFHSTLPEIAWRYPVPYEWATEMGIRRFGFHGLSVEWAVRQTATQRGKPIAEVNAVVAHLGSGCSVTAIQGGRSTWTSMGFTPLEGLMMGTRAGSIDPGVLERLANHERMAFDRIDRALERDSGLLGVSGVSSDLREVRTAADSGSERATLATQMFVAIAAQWIAAALTWVKADALVFTGGIGENDERTRSEITERLERVAGTTLPSQLVVESREDIVIADAVAELVGAD